MTEQRNKLSEVEQIVARARFREETKPLKQDNERKRQLGELRHEKLHNGVMAVGWTIVGCYEYTASVALKLRNLIIDYLSK